jgi:GTP cyclohydrolase I
MEIQEKKAVINAEEIEKAIQSILTWIGEDPHRPGLEKTPARVLAGFASSFAGYKLDPAALFSGLFVNDQNYDRLILVKDIRFESHCEHHMRPFFGHAHIAYVPDAALVGLSKLARLLDLFAKRLQMQERLTMQGAEALQQHLQPKGVAVYIAAEHHCMSTRGVCKVGTTTVTTAFLGCMQAPSWQAQFYQML